jgi:hypothetical protein
MKMVFEERVAPPDEAMLSRLAAYSGLLLLKAVRIRTAFVSLINHLVFFCHLHDLCSLDTLHVEHRVK